MKNTPIIGNIYKYISNIYSPFYVKILGIYHNSYKVKVLYCEDDWTLFSRGDEINLSLFAIERLEVCSEKNKQEIMLEIL